MRGNPSVKFRQNEVVRVRGLFVDGIHADDNAAVPVLILRYRMAVRVAVGVKGLDVRHANGS